MLAQYLTAFLLFAPQQDLIDEGLKALDSNQPAAAEALFRRATEAAPNDYSAHFNLALALATEQKDSEAIEQLERTLALKPDLYQARTNLATLLLRSRRPADAAKVLEPAADASLAPQQSARANLLLAQALEESGNSGQAESRYRRNVELDPGSAAGWAGLGRIALSQTNLPEAADRFRKASALDPNYTAGLLDVASAYEKAGKVAEAIELYKALPDNPAARDRVAQLMMDKGDASAAIPALEAAVQSSPTVANRLALADAYRMNKQADRAIRQLELAVASEPSNYDVRMDLGRELRDQRRLVAAAEQFAAAAKLRPDSVKAWNELSAILILNEDYANGLAALDHVRALGKEIAGDYFYRAIALERLRQPKPALEAYKQFLAADAGKMPDQEFQARQRIRIIESELNHK